MSGVLCRGLQSTATKREPGASEVRCTPKVYSTQSCYLYICMGNYDQPVDVNGLLFINPNAHIMWVIPDPGHVSGMSALESTQQPSSHLRFTARFVWLTILWFSGVLTSFTRTTGIPISTSTLEDVYKRHTLQNDQRVFTLHDSLYPLVN